jgi:hypothetical protein
MLHDAVHAAGTEADPNTVKLLVVQHRRLQDSRLPVLGELDDGHLVQQLQQPVLPDLKGSQLTLASRILSSRAIAPTPCMMYDQSGSQSVKLVSQPDRLLLSTCRLGCHQAVLLQGCSCTVLKWSACSGSGL